MLTTCALWVRSECASSTGRPHTNARDPGAYKPGDDTQTTIYAKKVVPRLALFGHLPPSMLPLLLQFSYAPSKKATLRLQRLVNYMVQMIVGDGSAGTCLPVGVPSTSTCNAPCLLGSAPSLPATPPSAVQCHCIAPCTRAPEGPRPAALTAC
jgi:hypothetical protein